MPVLASSAIPFAFPNQRLSDDSWIAMDGGTVWNTNIASAVKRCRETHEDKDIVVDILVCSSKSLPKRGDTGKTLENYFRYKDIKDYYVGVNDVVETMLAYPHINFRYCLYPSKPLVGGLDIIKVDNSTVTWPMQMEGRQDGETIVKGEHNVCSKMMEWKKDPEL